MKGKATLHLENDSFVTKFGKFILKCFGFDMCLSTRSLVSSFGFLSSRLKLPSLGEELGLAFHTFNKAFSNSWMENFFNMSHTKNYTNFWPWGGYSTMEVKSIWSNPSHHPHTNIIVAYRIWIIDSPLKSNSVWLSPILGENKLHHFCSCNASELEAHFRSEWPLLKSIGGKKKTMFKICNARLSQLFLQIGLSC